MVRRMDERQRDIPRMNPPILTGSKTLVDSQEFLDEVHKILVPMEAKDTEEVELASDYFKDVAHSLCKMWQDTEFWAEFR